MPSEHRPQRPRTTRQQHRPRSVQFHHRTIRTGTGTGSSTGTGCRSRVRSRSYQPADVHPSLTHHHLRLTQRHSTRHITHHTIHQHNPTRILRLRRPHQP
ncbi:hypothetical protein, partial [Streptomyces sp. DT171]|uniref:hypothetical protein n=1 Tax=Streptomyces sp. DT171 TaxID=3416524 RepID=UPI003CEAE6C8